MTHPHFDYESTLWNNGLEFIAGVDEVGRGAFAGPVVSAAVIFPKNLQPEKLKGLNDSKLLTPKRREYFVPIIEQYALKINIHASSASIINRIGIVRATFSSMRHAIANFEKLDHVLVDGFPIPHLRGYKNNQTAIIKGDHQSLSIAAASVIAKVYRDDLMQKYHCRHPHYHWENNKGYGTAQHIEALRKHGPCPLHRHMFIRKTGASTLR
jgi:ribonuclease HII